MWNSKTCFLKSYNFSTRFIGTEIHAGTYVRRENEVTTMPRYKLDAEFVGVRYMEEPPTISGSLNLCRFLKKRMLSVDEGLGGEVRCNGVIFTLS